MKSLLLCEIEKALQHRYIRRIPKAGGGYRYIYPDAGGDRHKAGVKVRLEAMETKGSDVVKGESFSAGPGKGHYTITAAGEGKISYILDDDGTGKSHEVHGMELLRFRSLVVEAHKDALRTKAAEGMTRLQGVVKAAAAHGTPKQQERAKALLAAFQAKYKHHLKIDDVTFSLAPATPKPSTPRDLLPGEVAKSPTASLGSLRSSFGKEFFSDLEQRAAKPGSNLNASSVESLGDWVSSVTPERFDRAANEVYRAQGDRFSAAELAAFSSVRKGELSSEAMAWALKNLRDKKSDDEMFAHLVSAVHLSEIAKNAPVKKLGSLASGASR